MKCLNFDLLPQHPTAWKNHEQLWTNPLLIRPLAWWRTDGAELYAFYVNDLSKQKNYPKRRRDFRKLRQLQYNRQIQVFLSVEDLKISLRNIVPPLIVIPNRFPEICLQSWNIVADGFAVCLDTFCCQYSAILLILTGRFLTGYVHRSSQN